MQGSRVLIERFRAEAQYAASSLNQKRLPKVAAIPSQQLEPANEPALV